MRMHKPPAAKPKPRPVGKAVKRVDGVTPAVTDWSSLAAEYSKPVREFIRRASMSTRDLRVVQATRRAFQELMVRDHRRVPPSSLAVDHDFNPPDAIDPDFKQPDVVREVELVGMPPPPLQRSYRMQSNDSASNLERGRVSPLVDELSSPSGRRQSRVLVDPQMSRSASGESFPSKQSTPSDDSGNSRGIIQPSPLATASASNLTPLGAVFDRGQRVASV